MFNQKRFTKKSIFTNISIVTTLLIVLSSLICVTFMFLHFSENLKEKDRILVKEAGKRIEEFMLDKYSMSYNQRLLMHSTDHVSSVLSKTRQNTSEIYALENLNVISNYLTSLCYSDNTILDTILFTSDGKNAFSYSNSPKRRVSLSFAYNTLPYIQDFQNTEHAITAIYDSAPAYIPAPTKENPAVITFICKIYDMNYPTQKKLLGFLMINFSISEITSTYTDIDSISSGEYVVINASSDIIYSNNDTYLGKSYYDGFLPEENIILNHPVSLSGIRSISLVSDQALQRSAWAIVWQALLVNSVSILILIIFVTQIHKFYENRFQQLATDMHKISQGDFTARFDVASEDELGYLGNTLNIMCETLDDYIKKTYLAETQLRTAEFHALQAQINPHFLANTLESIRMKALRDNNWEISEMLSNLGSLFRWMVQFDQNIVYLEDEFEFIDAYLNLQQFRFSQKLNVAMNIPPALLYFGFPRFTLQPLVENALTHGFPQNGKPLNITITAHQEDGTLKLMVADNGAGMSEDELISLRKHILDINSDERYGVALQNVHSRLQLLFGSHYGLDIKSRLYQGTTITLSLPAQKKKEMEKNVQIDNH